MIADGAAGQSKYGSSLATGDFDANGSDDLAIGAPFRDTSNLGFPIPDIGAVAVLYGHNGFLLTDGFESGDSSMWTVFPPVP
jgi:hypothetical protein